MQWFRTKAHAIRFLVALFLVALFLVALFLVAQFAGVVSSPLANAHAAAGARMPLTTKPTIIKTVATALTAIVTTDARIRTPVHATTPIIAARCMRSLPAFFRPRRRSTMPASPARRCVRP